MNWRLSLIGEVASSYDQKSPHLSRNVYLSPGSTLKNHQTIPINVHIHNQMNNLFGKGSIKNVDESIVEKIRQKWGALTTFSRISDANRISISLPQGKENLLLLIHYGMHFHFLYKYFVQYSAVMSLGADSRFLLIL